MKVRLTESQYEKLLKLVNPNKKLVITESQYKRLLLEFTGQFTGIDEGDGIKIISNGKEFTFKVFAVLNGELLVRNLNDGRYKTQYFLFSRNAIKNKTLRAEKSNVIQKDYNDIKELTTKEKNIVWKQFVFQNVTSFQVFNDDTFKLLIDPKIDVKTGKILSNPDDKEPEEIKQIDFKDLLIRGMEPNHMYQLTFYDDSTVKFKVSDKEGSVITIDFETVSERSFVDSNTFDKNTDEYKKYEVLRDELKNATTDQEKDEIQQKISDLIKSRSTYDKNNPVELKTIKKTVYNGAIATKLITDLENSNEYKTIVKSGGLKIDLDKVVKHPNKIKVSNKEQEAKINKLNQELSLATDDNEKKRIQAELKDVDRELTLHFLNPDFDVYDKVSDGLDTFDLWIMLTYRPLLKPSKRTKVGRDKNEESKAYVKNFKFYGIKNLTIIKDKVQPSLTDKREVNDNGEYSAPVIQKSYDEILNYFNKNTNANRLILSKPNTLMRILGAKNKGILPLEALQRELGNPLRTKDNKDKFIAGHLIQFEPDFNQSDIQNENQFNKFKRLISVNQNNLPKALVKRYNVGDNHVALNMKHVDVEEGKEIMYTMFIQNDNEMPNIKLGENEYYVELNYNMNNKQAKQPIAKFKITVKDYASTKLN